MRVVCGCERRRSRLRACVRRCIGSSMPPMATVDLRDPSTWVTRELFAAYCGPSSDKLLAYYDKAVRKKQLIVFDWNTLAFFLLPAWLGYRRQWTMWVTVVGVVVASIVIE